MYGHVEARPQPPELRLGNVRYLARNGFDEGGQGCVWSGARCRGPLDVGTARG